MDAPGAHPLRRNLAGGEAASHGESPRRRQRRHHGLLAPHPTRARRAYRSRLRPGPPRPGDGLPGNAGPHLDGCLSDRRRRRGPPAPNPGRTGHCSPAGRDDFGDGTLRAMRPGGRQQLSPQTILTGATGCHHETDSRSQARFRRAGRGAMTGRRGRSGKRWAVMDLHMHTPASTDFQETDVGYLDVLRRCEARGLDLAAFTDHNSIAGYGKMLEEIQQYELLESLGRLAPEEAQKLAEYRRLRQRILLLPGFEFTATFGFHILGIFPPTTSVREVEHLLLNLRVPGEALDSGSSNVGATSDVLSAYRLINEAGGLAIAAHANSSNGVAMRGFNFGGQTKIAYTQDPNLHALEVTDLEKRGRYSTATFFSGIKPEYPRRMHCIQGSDAHRLDDDLRRHNNLGIGGRVTEVLLPDASFEALKALFESNDFARTRPRKAKRQAQEAEFDFVTAAREQGSNIVQEFHESMSPRGGNLYNIIADICAFANTNGGTLFIGLDADPKRAVLGVRNPSQAIKQIEQEISKRISPALRCTVDGQNTAGKTVLREIG